MEIPIELTILLIEDNPGDVRLIREMLAEARHVRFEVKNADYLSEGLKQLKEETIDGVLLDLSLPDSQGLDTLTKVHSEAPDIPIIVLTGLDDEILGVEAVHQGAQDYLVKGQVDANLLTRTLRHATERKRIEVDLDQRRHALHLVISSMPNLLLQLDEQDCLSALFAPTHFQQLLKLSDEASLGKPLTETLPAEMVGDVAAAVRKVREQGVTDKFERSLVSDGKTAYLEIKVSPVVGTHDVLMVVDNITELKQTEIAEREQRVLSEALRDVATALNSTLELSEVLDRILTNLGHVLPHHAANIMLIESGMVRVVRCWSNPEYWPDETGLASDYSLDDIPVLRQMSETGQPVVLANSKHHPGWVSTQKTNRAASYCGAPIRLSGEVIGFLNLESTLPGFAAPKHAERLQAFADQAAIAIKNAHLYQELSHYVAELEVRNRELDSFAHTAAHDLKSPLSNILMIIALMREFSEDRSQQMTTLLETVELSAHKMNTIITSLLLLARLRDTQETVTEVEIMPVVESALERFGSEITTRKIVINIEPDMPMVLGYGPWIEEVFANLIGNAVKYIGKDNPAPLIAIRGTRQKGSVHFEVQDNGIGIRPQDQARLFEMFTRFHPGQAEGCGLGLSIVHRIVTKLNGRIGVESTPGTGSTFWFDLPAISVSDLEKGLSPEVGDHSHVSSASRNGTKESSP